MSVCLSVSLCVCVQSKLWCCCLVILAGNLRKAIQPVKSHAPPTPKRRTWPLTKFCENWAWPGLRDSSNFGALNANCANKVKGTDSRFDVHVPRESPDISPYRISEKGAWPNSRDPSLNPLYLQSPNPGYAIETRSSSSLAYFSWLSCFNVCRKLKTKTSVSFRVKQTCLLFPCLHTILYSMIWFAGVRHWKLFTDQFTHLVM